MPTLIVILAAIVAGLVWAVGRFVGRPWLLSARSARVRLNPDQLRRGAEHQTSAYQVCLWFGPLMDERVTIMLACIVCMARRLRYSLLRRSSPLGVAGDTIVYIVAIT